MSLRTKWGSALATEERGRSERIGRRAPTDDLHARNVPVEFRRRRGVCGV
jgi:hypothetical protein